MPREQVAALEALEKASRPRTNRYLDAYRRKEPRFPSATQRAGLLLNHREHVLFGGAAGGGKALALTTPLPTPTGWTAMGEVRAGDWLLDETGAPCRVVAATEVMCGHRVYDVEFSDGSVIRADAGHQWWTQTTAERAAIMRRDPVARAKRRAKRPKRGKGLKPWLAERNAARAAPVLPPPATGSVKTTEAIAATLRHGKAQRLNHSVAVAGALQLPEVALPIPPYTLGMWLGDGTSTSGGLTSADESVIEHVRADGFFVKKGGPKYLWHAHALIGRLRALGVLSNKHIPSVYLRASYEQRLALLQGLMDTDGTCGEDGRAEFTGCRLELVDGVLELVLSLGLKATMCEGVAMLNGRAVGPKYRISFHAGFPVFRLARKAQRQTAPGARCGVRYVVDVREVPSEPVRCVQVDSISHLYLAGRTFIPTHNSSWLLGSGLEYVDVPGYSAILFRRKYTDLRQPGALVPRSHEWLKGTDAHWRGDNMEWVFPSGAILKFGYMDGAMDHENYQGAEFQYVGFDESGQMEPHQMTYMQTRTRRLMGSEVPIRFRYTANPGGRAHSWLVGQFMLNADPNWVYIPSLAQDNPGLDVVDYLKRLSAISDPILRGQMRDGDWETVDRKGLICPEWTKDLEAKCTNADYGTPTHYTAYAGADPGNVDLFVILWGFFDFVNDRIVIVDERWFHNPSTREVGDRAVECEKEHFEEHRKAGRIDSFQRFSDVDHRFMVDLKERPWGLSFAPTQKTDHDMWERKMRGDIQQGRIIVHPRCDLLLRTLRHARRKSNGDYERTEDTGHADAWAALLYLYRNVNRQRNPFPPVVDERFHRGPVIRTSAQRAANGALPSMKPLL